MGNHFRRGLARSVRPPGVLLEAASNRRPREMTVRDKTRLIDPLRLFFTAMTAGLKSGGSGRTVREGTRVVVAL